VPLQPADELGLALALGLTQELRRGVHEQRAEDVGDPGPALEHRGARGDEEPAGRERAEDAPGEHAPLLAGGDLERREDDQEDEEVVDREALLEQVRGEELLARLGAEAPRDPAVEAERDGDPRDAPQERAPLRVGVIPTVSVEIDGHEHEHEAAEQPPCPHGYFDGMHAPSSPDKETTNDV